MSDYVTIKMYKYDLLDMLIERVKVWNDEPEVVELYEKMYESLLDSGAFEYAEFNVNVIVDNDIVNYCKVIAEEEYPEDFKKLLALHDAGEYDISCEEFEEVYPGFIEAVSDDRTMMLIRNR